MAAIDAADLALTDAGVAELVDAPDLGSGIARCGGSSPFARTRFVVRTRRTSDSSKQGLRPNAGCRDVERGAETRLDVDPVRKNLGEGKERGSPSKDRWSPDK